MNEEQTKKVLAGMELLSKLEPKIEFLIKNVADDSSAPGPDGEEGTVVKILHLAQPVTAEGSIPNDKGKFPAIRDNKIYVAGDDVTALALGLTENTDGTLSYKGSLKYDVSRPKYSVVRGRTVLTAPARIWLTSVSFRRKGRQLAADNRQKVRTSIDEIYSKEGPVDMVAWMEEYEKKNMPTAPKAEKPEPAKK